MYPALAGQLETSDRIAWNSAFSQILTSAVASEDVDALADGVRYLHWCWSQRSADEQFVYFVEYSLGQLLGRPADRAALCRVADDSSFAKVLDMYSHFHEKHEVVELEREYRFSHRPNKSFERTRER
jgi:hypothetical protein